MTHCRYRGPIAAVAAAAALIAGAGAAWSAPAVVTVHRGAETTVERPGADGLVVGRGAALTVRPPQPESTADLAGPLAAGRRLWMVDSEGRRLRVCFLARTTQVRGREIRCVARDFPD